MIIKWWLIVIYGLTQKRVKTHYNQFKGYMAMHNDFIKSIAIDMIIIVSVLSNDKYICNWCILINDNYGDTHRI